MCFGKNISFHVFLEYMFLVILEKKVTCVSDQKGQSSN
jgi:hypothetical protein